MRAAAIVAMLMTASLTSGQTPTEVCGPITDARTNGCYRCMRSGGYWVGHGAGVGRPVPDSSIVVVACSDPWVREAPTLRSAEFAAIKSAASAAPQVTWSRSIRDGVRRWVVTMIGPDGRPEARTETSIMSTGLVVTRVVELDP